MPPENPAGPAPVRKKIIPVPQRPKGELNRMMMEDQILSDVADMEKAARKGGRWFYLIAALSLFNTLSAADGGHNSFMAGLAITPIFKGILGLDDYSGEPIILCAGLVLTVCVCIIGYLSGRGSRTALTIGLVCYALDAVIFLCFGSILSAVIHGVVLYWIWQGWIARIKLDELRAESPTLAAAEGRAPSSPAPPSSFNY